VIVDLLDRARIGAEQARWPSMVLIVGTGVGNEPPLGLAIGRREEHVRRLGITNVLAVIRPSAARKSPPVWRATSPRCHFQAMHKRSLGSIAAK